MASNRKRYEREHPGEVAKEAAQKAEAQKKADFWKKNTKWFIIGGAVLLIAIVTLIIVLCNQPAPAAEAQVPTGTQYIAMDVANYGTIKAELYPDVAPITVANFLKLIDNHFYDGLTFHRVISGFMIQGGDPEGNGTGGSEETIKGEFSSNGWENNLKHTRGVLSMARSSDPDSASSQFFIMHEDASHLDGEYAAFGKVIEGMEVVDAICEKVTAGYNGAVDAENQPVITKMYRIEAPTASEAE